jgi:hypothetical protein
MLLSSMNPTIELQGAAVPPSEGFIFSSFPSSKRIQLFFWSAADHKFAGFILSQCGIGEVNGT